VAFGDVVESGQVLGWIDGETVDAQIAGTVRGLLLPGPVTAGLKIGDIDPRFDPASIYQISDKALSIGGGALEAVLVWLGDSSE
jgi:xanthine dehydrogenase accessory factor